MNKNFAFLNKVMEEADEYSELLKKICNNEIPIVCTGISDIHKAVIIACISDNLKKPVTVVTSDESEAELLLRDITSFGKNALYFPSRDYCFTGVLGESREYEHKRIHTLSAVLDGGFDVLILPAAAALQYTVPRNVLKENSFTIKVGQDYNLSELCEKLINAGYSRSETVEGAGQFSLRGGIVDIFTTHSNMPYRVEFWGDTVDSIAFFDTESQRRTDNSDCITITPACEVLADKDDLKAIVEELLQEKKISKERKERLEKDLYDIENNIFFSFDRYLPYIYNVKETVLDYAENTTLFISESSNMAEHIKNIHWQFKEDVKSLLEDGYVAEEGCDLMLSEDEYYEKISNSIILDNFVRGRYEFDVKALVDFNIKRVSSWNGDLDVLCDDLRYTVGRGGKAVVLAAGEKAACVLSEDLNDKGIASRYSENISELKSGVTVTVGNLSAGFEMVSQNFILITGRNVAARNKPAKRHKGGKSIGSLDELKVNDIVVHSAHGIGVFCGVKHITTSGITKDYIKIKYAGQDVLYVPVTQLDLVSRYIGTDAGNIKLNKLGSAEWHKTKSRVKKAVRDMADELTALYAKRMAAKGYAFSPDTDLQNNFERRFPYEETEDQIKCVNEIKADMERSVPMDRLLCGDVGFGKTEVALRAAFKCVCEGKQCAVLVPTTILAWQHYNTILKRIGELPVTVRLLSRFVTAKQQEKTVKDTAKGRVDILVGTHRLISKDVTFKDLGLVIIDEEQRFGVAQKERLKMLYPHVDILTLSATPIPRTLNMAMTGLRDMSSIDEAPGDRHPVQTYVLEQSNSILYDAIKKELRRGGQVYYLHNRVETIEKVAARIKTAIPEAKIAVAHGKMSEDRLSLVWRKLTEQEIDVLVCTTIIETGVDVANVNTLIIEDADRMGLSQLHQLRGRVGRSSRRAYAYFCFRTGKVLNADAAKRLEAIREFTEFGSGFRIAMRDLEIRGAGSILGGAQHGNMEAVGYDMYLKLLGDAMKEKSGEEVKADVVCTIDLNVPAHIPENYIDSLSARLGIYKRIADIESNEDAEDVIDELCDRFGEPPRAVMGLIDIALLRNKAFAGDIYEIVKDGNDLVLRMSVLNKETVGKLASAFGDKMRILMGDIPSVAIRMEKGKNLLTGVAELVKAL